jgi:hypothetical protein
MDLRKQALEFAVDGLGPDGMLIPFALASGPQGILNFTIVVDRSDEALEMGRKIVLDHANEIEQYVICVDTYLRIDGQRCDAILLEIGRRGEATVFAYRYERANGKATIVGNEIEFERRQSALAKPDPFLFDWGGITPDMFNEELNHAVHIVGHELESSENVARTIRFVRARARHFARHLPDGAKQSAFIEDRGQNITPQTRGRLASELGGVEIQYISELKK